MTKPVAPKLWKTNRLRQKKPTKASRIRHSQNLSQALSGTRKMPSLAPVRELEILTIDPDADYVIAPVKGEGRS